MTEPSPTSSLEAALRRQFRSRDPGPVPPELQARVDAVPATVRRARRTPTMPLVLPLVAAVSIIALAVVGTRSLPLVDGGPGATPGPGATFDPTLAGLGQAPANTATLQWLLVVVGALALAAIPLAWRGRRRLAGLVPAIGLIAYAAYASFVPLGLRVTGFGPGIGVASVTLPAGVEGALYYVTSKPRQPFSLGLLLIADGPPLRVEGLVDDGVGPPASAGMSWSALWLDGDTSGDGGITGAAAPFRPISLSGGDARAVWLVGRAGACATGALPPASGGYGSETATTIRLNVSVLGWPRVEEIAIPRIVEIDGPCPSPSPAPGP